MEDSVIHLAEIKILLNSLLEVLDSAIWGKEGKCNYRRLEKIKLFIQTT